VLKKSEKSEAHVVDGKLILSLPGALRPVVWQMDLGKAKASALEILPGEESRFDLVLKTPGGEKINIAPFAAQSEALNALKAAAKALAGAKGQIQSAAAHQTATAPAAGPKRGWGKILTITLVVLAALFIIFMLIPPPPGYVPPGAQGPDVSRSGSPPPGEPMSADDFLQRRP